MKKNGKKITKDVENIDGEELFEGVSPEIRERFERELLYAARLEFSKPEQDPQDFETPPPSRRHKIRMNRLFRERLGATFLPFPEADNLYERLRSRLIVKIKRHRAK